MHCGTAQSVNSAKPSQTVDPPVQKYGTILGDAPQQGDCERGAKGRCPPTACAQMPIPTGLPGWNQILQRCPVVIQLPCDPASPRERLDHPSCKPCPPCPPQPPSKTWFLKLCPVPPNVGLNRLFMFLLSFCLPIGGEAVSSGKLVFCFPPQPPPLKPPKPQEELKPIGYISRNKDVDFIGGKLIGGCTCGKKNGLGEGSCPRISCRNNPGCTMNPPRCWPAIKLPDPPPPPPPDQKMICVPIQLVYKDPTGRL